MKEYKIIRQKQAMCKSTDSEFEAELNNLAREGWRVITSLRIGDTNSCFKVLLERDKSR